MNPIFEDQTTAVKLNLSFGFILRNNETEQFQYHHSSINNNRVFDSPFLIRNAQDLEQVPTAISNLDVLERARQQRPNSNVRTSEFNGLLPRLQMQLFMSPNYMDILSVRVPNFLPIF